MIFASVCSGIEAASTAWHPLGWRASWLSEIDPFACSVLAHHYPDVPNLGDMTRIGDEEIAQHDRPDVLVGGTPCQSFSVAGLRKGMADPRGNLALVFLRLLERTRARWVVWENVPGVLSSAGGRDFGAFLGALGQLGYGWAYRVLDAQYFGLAQRRKRVFVVGRAGGLTNRAAAVLFERACLRGDPAPSREAGARVAHCVAAGSGGGKFGSGRDGQDDFVVSALDCQRGGPDDNAAQAGHLIPTLAGTIVGGSGARGHRGDDAERGTLIAHSLRADGFDASEDGTGRGTPIVPAGFHKTGQGWWSEGLAGLRADPGGMPENVIAFGWQNSASQGDSASQHHTPTLDKSKTPAVSAGTGVRRLTPRECERLQGFPDDYTLVPHRGKPASDGPRYRALGNSMAVPVMAWIGKRIQMVEDVSC